MSFSSFAQRIEGLVINYQGDVLENANVMIQDKGTITNKQGEFVIIGLKPGKDSITVSYLGYQSQTKEINLSKEKTNRIKFILSPIKTLTKEIVIKASGRDYSSLKSLPVRIQTIENKDIDDNPAINIGNLFNNVSGVDVNNSFGNFSSSTIVSLRGLGGSSQKGTLIVLDGVPLNKTGTGSVNWNMINKDNIERIEIVKGPGSVLYGSNAMGGIINIISQKPISRFSSNVSLAYGRYNTINAGLNLSGQDKKNVFFWDFSSNYNLSDGYINTPQEIIDENDSIVVPVFLKEKSIGANIGYDLNENNRISLSVNVFDDIRGTGVQIYEDFGANITHLTYHCIGKYSGTFNNIKLYSNIYYLNEKYGRQNEYFSDGEYKLYETNANRYDYGTRIWSETNISKSLELVSGIDIKNGIEQGTDTYFTSSDLITNNGSLVTFAGFARLKYSIIRDKLNIVPGIRYDVANFYDALFSIQEPSYAIEYLVDYQFDNIEDVHWDAINPKLSIEYNFNPKYSMYLSIAKGFSAPLLEDLSRTGRKKSGFKVANPNLTPEYVMNYEIGGDFRFFNKVSTSISSYYTLGNDFMYFLSTGDTVNMGYTLAPIYQVDNISKVQIIGTEVDVRYDITKKISLYANYTYNHSTIKEFVPETDADNDITGNFLTDIPMHKASLGFNFDNKYLNFSVTGKYTGERWLNDENKVDEIYLMTDKYPSCLLTNVKFWKKYKNLMFSLNVENLFDVEYVNSKGYLSPGRFYLFKINYKINYL